MEVRVALKVLASTGLFTTGAILYQQYALFNYLYQTAISDYLPLALFLALAIWIGLKIEVSDFTYLMAGVSMVCLISLFPKVIDLAHEHSDMSSVLFYPWLILTGVFGGLSAKRVRGFIWSAFILIPAGIFLTSFIHILPLYLLFALTGIFWLGLKYKLKAQFWLSLPILAVCVFSYNQQKSKHTFSQQARYFDKVLFSTKTPFYQVDVTSWKHQQWFYYDNVNQFTSIDYWLYYEPMAHPALQLAKTRNNILIVGGENGLLTQEILKYNDVVQVEMLPLDTALISLASQEPVFTKLNNESLNNEKVSIKKQEIFRYLSENKDKYDLIFIDVPDPANHEFGQYYTLEFYDLCRSSLMDNGVVVTQAGSPYLSAPAFYTIENTIRNAGFTTLPLHNQVLTLGEWGWVIGSKDVEVNLSDNLIEAYTNKIDTRWLNQDAIKLITSFGKPLIKTDCLEINTIKNPVLNELYSSGTWSF